MKKFGVNDKGNLRVFNKNTNETIIEKEVEINTIKFGEFLEEYHAFEKCSDYEQNKDKVRTYLINKYFIS